MTEINLRVPGPTPVPGPVAQAGARPMVNHRGPEFAATMRDLDQWLKPYFGTTQDVLLLTGSGTGALEAAVVNMLSPGDEVLAVTIGVFGDRFAEIAEAFGATVTRLSAEWGKAIDPDVIHEAVRERPNLKAVLLTHNETSTGVTNDVAACAAAIRGGASGEPPLILVDGVSSVGAIPFEMDEWGVDLVVTGSQKAWMSPPGMAMIAVSPRGWEAYAQARMPRYYWDISKARKNALKATTPFTPAVGVVTAMHEALRLMQAEGIEETFARHRRVGTRMRQGIAGLGLELFADPAVASNTVTAVRVPAGVDASALLKDLRQRHGVVLGSGQDWLKGSIFRVGHMGFVNEGDIDGVITALDAALRDATLEEVG